MPIPAFVAGINRRVTNRLMRRFAGRIPPLALLTHRGRRSGRQYDTPVMAFPTGEDVLIALTYGRETDWLRNVLAAGGCSLTYRRRRLSLTDPLLFESDPDDQPLPGWVRFMMHRMDVTGFLRLRRGE